MVLWFFPMRIPRVPQNRCGACGSTFDPGTWHSCTVKRPCSCGVDNCDCGTPAARWRFLLAELEKRFPTPPEVSVRSDITPEQWYLQQIDALLNAK